MTRRPLLLLLVLALTAAWYVVVLFATGFVACGVSGCSGGGFGPSYAPRQAQVGLLVAGASLVPLALLAVPRGVLRAPGAVVAFLGGALLAMLLLGLGPHGCPSGLARTTAGADAFSPGSPTCSRD